MGGIRIWTSGLYSEGHTGREACFGKITLAAVLRDGSQVGCPL